MDHFRDDRIRCQGPVDILRRPTIDLDVAKSMEREFWGPACKVAAADKSVRGLRVSQRTCIQFIFLNHFRVAEYDAVAAGFPHACGVRGSYDAQTANNVPPEIEYRLARSGLRH